MIQLRPCPEILAQKNYSLLFDRFLAIAEEFAAYIKSVEGVNTVAIHPHERDLLLQKFNNMPIEKQLKKFYRFEGYYEHCREIVSQGYSLKDKKTSIKAFMKKYGLKFANEDDVFEVMDQQTFIEIYDLDFIQCYRSIDFLNATSHSMMALETCEWWDLFERSTYIGDQIMSVVQSIYSGAVREPVYMPVESHTVKELGSTSPLSSQADIILYGPVYDERGLFQGGLHLFKIKSVYSLDFKVWN